MANQAQGSNAQIPTINIDKVKLTFIKKLKLRPGLEKGSFTGICQLPDKTVVLAHSDMAKNQGRLYSIESDGTKFSSRCEKAPFGISYFKDDLLVSYPKTQEIGMVDIDDLIMYETFAKGYEFRGISTNGTDVVSISKGKGISFMNKSGYIYKEFPIKSTDRKAFIHFDKEYIYFTDAEGQYIKCMNTIGKRVWRCELSYEVPYGVCIDMYGNVFVADRENGDILIVAADGSKYRSEFVEEIEEPTALCFDKENCQLIVADRFKSPCIYQVTYR
ncbi:Hypothetical predicted protein [Mytilus galloprovincialis]|uniref:Uncharacterized protein n=1 Tax=Mytilus galloprovincialis TaxID=29158 RepID=A0A8B6DYB4_MYTGA|nr:Hypothetical predicted protein [Mytilus galloprovincialis]